MDRFITQIGQSKAILGFISVIGIVLGYLSYSGSDSLVIPEEPASSQKRVDSIESLSNFKIDFSILDNQTYKSLEIFGENPVVPGITGERKNPFLPI